MAKLGEVVPNFDANTTAGKIKYEKMLKWYWQKLFSILTLPSFHEWLGGSWAVFFSHPADYTPVCTTELGRVEKLRDEFKKRGCKLIALSCDDTESHKV